MIKFLIPFKPLLSDNENLFVIYVKVYLFLYRGVWKAKLCILIEFLD